jgi:hydrophobic/amphiphilic exporter-1 (mainly G- bacteria), HAE1 family
MNISELSIKRPVTVIMSVLAVVVLGLFSFMRVPVDLLPNLDIPVAVVSTTYTGAGPQEIENLVTRNIESVMATVTNTRTITSTTSEGNSLVIVQFNDGTDMNFATLEMREKIDLIRGVLPDGVGDPVIIKIDPNNLIPIVQIGISSNVLDGISLKSFVEDNIKTRLERILGVASVNVSGGAEREILIHAEPQKLEGYGLSLAQLANTLRGDNLNLPGGSVRYGNRNLTIKSKGEFTSIQDIENIPIILPQGNIIYLRNVAQVKDTLKETRAINRINGENNIGLLLQKQTDANTVSVVSSVRQELDKLRLEYPQVNIDLIFDQAEIVEQSISNVTASAVFGGILAIFILLIFLKSIRATLVIGIAIPVSIIATFILMFLSNTSLNLISMGGLALGVGMMVDSSIVVIENIYRQRMKGEGAISAAIKGARQVSGAVIASTLTTVVVFLPIIFTEGWAADLFKQMALTVTFSLLSALVVALTLIPMLSSKMLKENPSQSDDKKFLDKGFSWWEAIFNKIQNFYVGTLKKLLHKRILTIVGVGIIFVSSIVVVPFIGFEFLPTTDEGSFTVNIEYPEGTLLENTDNLTLQIEELIREIPDIEQIFVTIGGGGNMLMGGSSSNTATITASLVERGERGMSTAEVVEWVREGVSSFPGATINVNMVDSAFGGGGGPAGGAPILIEISGFDLERLTLLSEEVKMIVEGVEGTRQVESSISKAVPEVSVTVDRMKASQYGINAMSVASNIRTAMEGQVVTKYRLDGEEIDVKVEFSQDQRERFDQLSSLKITAPTGANVTLGEIARIEQELGPLSISRKNQTRYVTVEAQLFNRSAGNVISEIEEKIKAVNVPEGYIVAFGGQNEEMMSAFRSLGLALVLSILLIYMVMAAQFESFSQPFIIMFSVPLSFSGAAIGLGITGRTFNVATFIGIIMLGGIVVNNAIILVDYINQLVNRGMDRDEAITTSVSIRLRPILMTTMTTVLGMFPLALGIGEGAEIQAPFATVVIFGLLFSTLLTLLLVPVIYSLFDDVRRKFKWKTS